MFCFAIKMSANTHKALNPILQADSCCKLLYQFQSRSIYASKMITPVFTCRQDSRTEQVSSMSLFSAVNRIKKIPLAFCRGNQDNANIRVQKYVVPAPLYHERCSMLLLAFSSKQCCASQIWMYYLYSGYNAACQPYI